ncbi:RNA polymerase sigma factor [Bacillus sp. CGMCC 1.16607]|uniref:RNA polymerase sigma factor n=1 Tax=Bacillus sp. CGMCC 1.16607 TaxID=3351842 RepID=UPI003629B9FD
MKKNREQLVMEWYELFYDDLYRFILFMLADKQCCEDLVHDTFVRAYSASERFENRSNVKTWLFSIAKHVVIDEIRKRKRRRLFSIIGLEKEIPSTTNIEQHIENKEAVLELMNSIYQLKSNYRLVIILKKIEECSTKEISEILNWSEVKVRKTLSRAMQALMKMENIEGGGQVEQSI